MNLLSQFNPNDLQVIERQGLQGFRFAGNNIGDIITSALPIVFFAAGTLLLIYIIWGGIEYMLAKGDPKAIQEAKSKLTNGIIGFIIVFAAYWITRLVGLVLNLRAITNSF